MVPVDEKGTSLGYLDDEYKSDNVCVKNMVTRGLYGPNNIYFISSRANNNKLLQLKLRVDQLTTFMLWTSLIRANLRIHKN